MPDASIAQEISPARARAITSIEGWLTGLPCGFEKLRAEDLGKYSIVDARLGWRIQVSPDGAEGGLPGEPVFLDILADSDFPYSPPQIAVSDPSVPILQWPHVEDQGILCLLPGAATIDVDAPLAVLQSILADACKLVDDSRAGLNRDDYLAEFTSYWQRTVSREISPVRSIARPSGPSRLIRVWRGRNFHLVADDSLSAISWLSNSGIPTEAKSLQHGLFVWLDRALYPNEYPSRGEDVLPLLEHHAPAARPLLDKILAQTPQDFIVVLGADTVNGPGLASLVVQQDTRKSKRDGRGNMKAGFSGRPLPGNVAEHRYLPSARVHRSYVTRADAAWVHGRGHDERSDALRSAKVAVLGCGSVGAPIAVRLAQTGVGRVLLVDNDPMCAANVGRHPLGASYVGQNKALALARHLKRRFPHIQEVEGVALPWSKMDRERPELLGSCDLVVASMAHWSSDAVLNEWHLRQGRVSPIVYAWTEAHACAGHAVMIGQQGGCLRCGFTATGTPLLRVTAWATETLVREPACGGIYQPYGPVELAQIESLATELALDALLIPPENSTHRIWAARAPLLAAAGGSWSAEWTALHPDRASGGFIDERAWAQGPCDACRRLGTQDN